jgi:hypothetical protein
VKTFSSSNRSRVASVGEGPKLYPFHVQPVQGLQQGTNFSVYSFLGERCARLYTTKRLCHSEAWVYATEVWVCEYLINRIRMSAADIVACLVRGSVWRHCEACGQAEGGHFEQLLRLCSAHSVRWEVPTTRTGSRPAMKWRLKNATKGRIWFVSLQWGINWQFNDETNCCQHGSCTNLGGGIIANVILLYIHGNTVF